MARPIATGRVGRGGDCGPGRFVASVLRCPHVFSCPRREWWAARHANPRAISSRRSQARKYTRRAGVQQFSLGQLACEWPGVRKKAAQSIRRCSHLRAKCWSERGDSNSRPLAPEVSAPRVMEFIASSPAQTIGRDARCFLRFPGASLVFPAFPIEIWDSGHDADPRQSPQLCWPALDHHDSEASSLSGRVPRARGGRSSRACSEQLLSPSHSITVAIECVADPMIGRLEHAIVLAAYIVLRHGTVYAPYIDRLEKELEAARRSDPTEHARRILETYTAAGGRNAMRLSHSRFCSSDGPNP